MVHQKQTRQVEGEFDMEIVSLIVQQLHAGVISLLPFAPIWLILLNLVTNYACYKEKYASFHRASISICNRMVGCGIWD